MSLCYVVPGHTWFHAAYKAKAVLQGLSRFTIAAPQPWFGLTVVWNKHFLGLLPGSINLKFFIASLDSPRQKKETWYLWSKDLRTWTDCRAEFTAIPRRVKMSVSFHASHWSYEHIICLLILRQHREQFFSLTGIWEVSSGWCQQHHSS